MRQGKLRHFVRHTALSSSLFPARAGAGGHRSHLVLAGKQEYGAEGTAPSGKVKEVSKCQDSY